MIFQTGFFVVNNKPYSLLGKSWQGQINGLAEANIFAGGCFGFHFKLIYVKAKF